MTNTILNINLLDSNNLIFTGIVLGSAATVSLFGYSCYLGYNYFYPKTDFSSSTDTKTDFSSSTGSTTPVIKINIDSGSGSTTPIPHCDSEEISRLINDIPLNRYINFNLPGETHSPYGPRSPVNILPEDLICLKSDASTQTNTLTSDVSVQTSDDLLVDYFNQLIADMQSETSSHNYTSFLYSPVSPSVRIGEYLNSLPVEIGIQTMPGEGIIDLIL